MYADYLEKIHIYVPKTLARDLDRDARLFEVLKRDGVTVNRNRFLGMVIRGHYDEFAAERLRLTETVDSELRTIVTDTKSRYTAANRVMHILSDPVPPSRRIKDSKRLSFKPTRDTEVLVREILDDLRDEPDQRKVSRFFLGLLASYRSKASYERELIVFAENAGMLRSACESRDVVAFATTQNRETIHRVVPYRLVAGGDDLLNYLLCYEAESPYGPAMTYRLSRIDRPRRTGERGAIPEDVRKHLRMMERLGPQFAINDDSVTCVRLTEDGVRQYRRVYRDRPEYIHEEDREGGKLYFFRCSQEQLFLYFRRFGFGTAEVLSPESLRSRMVEFHQKSLEMYRT